jgi:hypothetical protein
MIRPWQEVGDSEWGPRDFHFSADGAFLVWTEAAQLRPTRGRQRGGGGVRGGVRARAVSVTARDLDGRGLRAARRLEHGRRRGTLSGGLAACAKHVTRPAVTAATFAVASRTGRAWEGGIVMGKIKLGGVLVGCVVGLCAGRADAGSVSLDSGARARAR